MKTFRIVGVARAAAALAACGGNATDESNAVDENVALGTENLELNATDLNATDLNGVSVDANTVTANNVVVENGASDAAADNAATNAE
jgi:hypothetical protein